MNKYLLSIAAFVCLSQFLYAQCSELNWSGTIEKGNLGFDRAYDITSTQDGKTFITGIYQSGFIWGDDTLHSSAGNDFFIGSLNSDFDPIIAFSSGDSVSDCYANAIAVDENGYVYVTGKFWHEIEFSNGTIIEENATLGFGLGDMFVAKFDSLGNPIWARSAGWIHDDLGHDISVDSDGNVFVTGQIQGTVNFGDTVELSASGLNTPFLVKYDANGIVHWARSKYLGFMSGSGRGVACGSDGGVYTVLNSDSMLVKYDGQTGEELWSSNTSNIVSFDLVVANGMIYTAGLIGETAFFNNDSLQHHGNGDIVITAFDTSGILVWAQNYGGPSMQSSPTIAVDVNNDLYVAGNFRDSIQIGSYSAYGGPLGNSFVAKLNDQGSPLWLKTSSGPNYVYSSGITAISPDHIFQTGWYDGTGGSFGSFALDTFGSSDIYVAELSEYSVPLEPTIAASNCLISTPEIEGIEYQWNLNGISIPGADQATHFAIENGYYSVTILDQNLCQNVSDSIFLSCLPVGMDYFSNDDATIEVYPNPAENILTIDLYQTGKTNFQIYNLVGQEVLNGVLSAEAKHVNIGALANGTYFIKIFSGEAMHSIKLIKY